MCVDLFIMNEKKLSESRGRKAQDALNLWWLLIEFSKLRVSEKWVVLLRYPVQGSSIVPLVEQFLGTQHKKEERILRLNNNLDQQHWINNMEGVSILIVITISVSELGAGAGDQLRSAPAPSGAIAELQVFLIEEGAGWSWKKWSAQHSF